MFYLKILQPCRLTSYTKIDNKTLGKLISRTHRKQNPMMAKGWGSDGTPPWVLLCYNIWERFDLK